MRDLLFDIRARDRTGAGFDAARGRSRALKQDFDRIGTSMRGLEAQAKAFAAGLTVIGISALVSGMRDAVAEGAKLVDIADKIGVPVEDLQRLQFGFSQAGVEASSIEQSLTQWGKRIGEAHTHGGRLADIFKANGVSLTNQQGRLRSSVDLMRDYAELVKNAGSDQERILLATEGFGRAGADMVLAFQDGANGLDDMMRAADDAGAVMDEQMLRRAAEIDDKFEAISITVETNLKSALIGAADIIDQMATGVDNLGKWLSELGNADIFDRAARLLGVLDENGKVNPSSGLLPPPNERSRVGTGAFSGGVLGDDEFDRRFSGVGQTVIPDDSGNRKRSARAAREQRDAYAEVIEKLEEERQLIGLSEVDQRVLIAQRRAGVDATSAYGLEIERLVELNAEEQAAIDATVEANERLQDSFEDLADTASDFSSSIVKDLLAGEDAAQSLGDALGRVGSRLIDMGTQGFFDLLFSGSTDSGGFFSSLFGGFKAAGGPVDPWKSYVVGEKGPELLTMGSSGGSITPNGQAFGGQGGQLDIGVQFLDDGTLSAFIKSYTQRHTASAIGEVMDSPGFDSRVARGVVTGRRTRESIR